MILDEEHVGDWKDASAYAPLLQADRSIFAWEWLRRDPLYREAAEGSAVQEPSWEAERWGLIGFESPRLPAPLARPVWAAAAHPPVLEVLARGRGSIADSFELGRFGGISTLIAGRRREHLLISDGLQSIRLDVLAGTLAQGPAELRYLLAGISSVERPLLTLRRMLALARTGRFSRSLHPQEPRARTWVLMLRACDALQSGADQRQIAEILLNRGASEPRWRSFAPSLRSRAQRLVRSARRMAAGSYRGLLQ
jgi:hypothetical protein